MVITSTPSIPLPQSGSNHNMNDQFGSLLAPATSTASMYSNIPAKRSDDEIEFISSQPVKKQKLTHPKLQINVTPPPPPPAQSCIKPQEHVQRHVPQESQLGTMVPDIQLTPAPITQVGVNGQTEAEGFSQDRRVSTGMVGLPSDFHEVEASYSMRGASLPISTCLQNFVLDQPIRKSRPMSSPPLSPRQLPAPTISLSLLNGDTPDTVDMAGYEEYYQPTSQFSENHSSNRHAGTAATGSTANPNTTVVLNRLLTPSSSPSPTQMMDVEKSISSTLPPAPIQPIQHCEQSPDRMKQTPLRSQQSPITPTINKLVGPKPPCQACAAQRALMARAQGLPLPMMNMQQIPTHTKPQIPCHPMNSFPPSHPPFMTIPGLNPGFQPMMMPMHVNSFSGMMQNLGQQYGNMAGHRHTTTPAQQQSIPVPLKPHVPTTVNPDEMRQATPPIPTPTPSTPLSPLKQHPSLHTTHRKPARNLIVDIAETCQENFPFKVVAKRQGVPVEKVIEVFTAIIGVPLLRSASDRRRPGKVATSRIREYQRAKKEIEEDRAGAREVTSNPLGGASKDKVVVRPSEIAQQLGPVDMSVGLGLHS